MSMLNWQPFCEFGGGGTTTTVQKSDPWAEQKPYLTGGFKEAQNLYMGGAGSGPQYFPGSTHANPTQGQTQALSTLQDVGLGGGIPQAGQARQATSNLLGQDFLYSNPGNSIFSNVASGNIANTSGADVLSNAAHGGLTSNMGVDTLNQFASGDMAKAGNPYFQSMAQSIAANVLPSIQGQFAQGNRLDSGLASRAVGEGLGGAIGNLAYQNYQQGLGQQLGAAGTLSNIGQNRVQDQLSAALGLGQLGQGNLQAQIAGAQGLSGNYNTAVGNQLSGIGQAQNLNQQYMGGLGTAAEAGGELQNQSQAQINDAIQRYNYNQQLPYSNLNNYMNLIQGNYGGTSATSQPYFNNTLGQIGAGLGGIASILPFIL